MDQFFDPIKGKCYRTFEEWFLDGLDLENDSFARGDDPLEPNDFDPDIDLMFELASDLDPAPDPFKERED